MADSKPAATEAQPPTQKLTELELEVLALAVHYARRCNCDSGDGDRMMAIEMAPTIELLIARRSGVA